MGRRKGTEHSTSFRKRHRHPRGHAPATCSALLSTTVSSANMSFHARRAPRERPRKTRQGSLLFSSPWRSCSDGSPGWRGHFEVARRRAPWEARCIRGAVVDAKRAGKRRGKFGGKGEKRRGDYRLISVREVARLGVPPNEPLPRIIMKDGAARKANNVKRFRTGGLPARLVLANEDISAARVGSAGRGRRLRALHR